MDVQINRSKTIQLMERRAALKTQQENRYAKFRGSRRASNSRDNYVADKFIKSVYGKQLVDESAQEA